MRARVTPNRERPCEESKVFTHMAPSLGLRSGERDVIQFELLVNRMRRLPGGKNARLGKRIATARGPWIPCL